MIEVHNIDKSYARQRVFREFSLKVCVGENIAIVGPSGAGKSTLLRLLCGFESADKGQIFIDGRLATLADRVLVPPHQRSISIVFQDLGLWPHLTVAQNVDITGRAHDVDEVMRTFRVAHLRSKKPGHLSGGEQQRVALARAVASQPKYLVLDEPFTGIDRSLKAQLIAEVTAWAQQRQSTIIVVTHDMVEASALGAERKCWITPYQD